jgi:hypothetical protein
LGSILVSDGEVLVSFLQPFVRIENPNKTEVRMTILVSLIVLDDFMMLKN